jgi:glutamine amidotransferase
MITVVDYGLGNLASVANAFEKLAIPYRISAIPEVIQQAQAMVLPGVGAAEQGMKNLVSRQLDSIILDRVNADIPILGICLGMQLLFTFSEEGNVSCMDLIKGNVRKLRTMRKVPQVGWNQVRIQGTSQLMYGIKDDTNFYFVNSYFCMPDESVLNKGITDYGEKFCSIVERNNLYGVQFHPEKSGQAGLQLLRNFWRIIC